MNNLLQVKLAFNNEKNDQKTGTRNLRSKALVSADGISRVISDLRRIQNYYSKEDRIVSGMLIDIEYNDIIAKSSRVREIIKPSGCNVNDRVVGARFSNAKEGDECHIITYYVDDKTVGETIVKLEAAKRFVEEKLSGKAEAHNFNEFRESKGRKARIPFTKDEYEAYGLSKSAIRNIIVDCSVIERLGIPNVSAPFEKETVLITFFKTEMSVDEILIKIEADKYPYSFYGNDTISVRWDMYERLKEDIPYLISMISADLSKITIDDVMKQKKEELIEIPKPSYEPVIGVIDTLFDEKVYFSDWVEYKDCQEEYEKNHDQDAGTIHGTEVTSIIVDGPRMNPWLDDGCGRFRVRHFGVCQDKISVSRLVRKITDIVKNNPDIHVWNLSLGTDDEVSNNFISYDAAAIDELQAKNNVIFVISGTNDNRDSKAMRIRIGSPADSLNSVVVNSVKRNGSIASYSRKGRVLSFFNKPDVSYYGGDEGERIIAYAPYGEEEVCGTSFAAPWISRKLCYLIDVLSLPRENAKALIIDAAAGWEYKNMQERDRNLIGYGVVPIDISKIITTDNSEIKFLVYGESKAYRTINNYIPVPKDSENKYPYVARAVLCYFPECTRAQGVDYTDRELSLKFGRVKTNGTIEDINDNVQDDLGSYSDERQSRKEFRKWENTKLISKKLKKNRALKAYEDRQWGFSVTSKERLTSSMKKSLNFGAVITLREINGTNRIQEFISACTMRGWIVNELDIESRVNLYSQNQEEIVLE